MGSSNEITLENIKAVSTNLEPPTPPNISNQILSTSPQTNNISIPIDGGAQKNENSSIEDITRKSTVITDVVGVSNYSDEEDEEDDIDDIDNYSDLDNGVDINEYSFDSNSKLEESDSSFNTVPEIPQIINKSDDQQLSSVQNNTETNTTVAKNSRLDKIAAMKLEVEEDARKKIMAQMGLSLESITILWENYRDKRESMSTKTALGNCKLYYEQKNIKVTVPNASTKGIVLQEHRLMDEIRAKFGLQDITLEVNIDPSLFPEMEVAEISRKLNPREIHQLFAKKNPNFEKLIRDLKLKSDNGA